MDATKFNWKAYTGNIERNISPPLKMAVTIVPAEAASGIVIYVGVGAFTQDQQAKASDLRALARHIEQKLNN